MQRGTEKWGSCRSGNRARPDGRVRETGRKTYGEGTIERFGEFEVEGYEAAVGCDC